MQKWQTGDITEISNEKAKHVQFDVAGPSPASLHFNVGSKDQAEAVIAKLESSRALSQPDEVDEPEPEPEEEEEEDAYVAPPPPSRAIPPSLNSLPAKKGGASVRFAPDSPIVIPPRREPSVDEDADTEPEDTGYTEVTVALYDFDADGEDELTVKENDKLVVVEKGPDEGWWKCRNARGQVGVVPSAYLQVTIFSFLGISMSLTLFRFHRLLRL